MAQLDTQILPLLPLTSGVVLPGMVVTLTIESDEAQRAIAASESSDGTAKWKTTRPETTKSTIAGSVSRPRSSSSTSLRASTPASWK